jgi:hypothetical protein
MYECPHCDRRLNTQRSLEQHITAVHDSFACTQCDRILESDRSLKQHIQSKHSSSTLEISDLDSPSGLKGYWVLTKNFKKYKSFGAFECSSCGKYWVSAHSFKKFKQACQKCNIMVRPKFMWVNTGKRDSHNESDDDDGPHDTTRCEACQLYGDCTKKH